MAVVDHKPSTTTRSNPSGSESIEQMRPWRRNARIRPVRDSTTNSTSARASSTSSGTSKLTTRHQPSLRLKPTLPRMARSARWRMGIGTSEVEHGDGDRKPDQKKSQEHARRSDGKWPETGSPEGHHHSASSARAAPPVGTRLCAVNMPRRHPRAVEEAARRSANGDEGGARAGLLRRDEKALNC